MNSQTNLTVGDVTADEVEVEIRTPAVPIKAGEKLTYYQIDDGVENLIGVFYAEAPTVATKTSIRFKAYDGKAKLAADFSEWLNGNQDKFPMTLRSLAGIACEVAGITLAVDSFQFDNLSIPAFYAQGVTCRQIVSWAAQIAGCFVSCNTAGKIFFDWYRKTDISVGKTDFSQDGLSKKSYSTDLIKQVQFKQETNDVGVIYPADADGNAFSISRNGIAAVLDSDTLRTIAQSLYEKLKSITYTPLSVRLPKRTVKIRTGDIISVTDGNGSTVSTYVMKVYLDSSGTQISSTGDQNYADKAAVSSEQYRNIPGKVLLLEKSVDGLRIENKDTADKVATLELTVDGLKTSVKDAEGNITKLEQSSKEITASVESVKKTSEEALKEAQKNATDLTNYANQVSGSLTDLQNQIDGAIETWFYDYEPTTTNAPASSWTTTEDKNKHLGDLFYVVDNEDKGGLVYRWALTNGVYGWVLVEDTEVAKALETASKAKDTADGKRRVFVAQPKPPYDVGDLWTNNTDLYVCQTARAEGSYTASDWKLATEYTTEKAVKALIKVSEESISLSVKSVEKKADGAASAASKAQKTADGIEVGGRNLIIGASKYRESTPAVTGTSSDAYVYLTDTSVMLEKGKTYTLQACCDLPWSTGHGSGAGTGKGTIWIASVDRKYHRVFLGDGVTAGRYVWKFEHAGDTGDYQIRVNGYVTPAKFWDFKVESGNKPTDWTPAPEDTDEDIKGLQDDLASISDEVSVLKVTSKGVDMTSEDSNGKLVSFIGNRDAGGAWEAKYTKNGSVTSALYFDFAKGSFVFDGHVVARSGEIGGCLIVDGNLQVPAANIYGALTFGDGSYYIDPGAKTSYLKLPGLEITSSGASFTGAINGGSININDRFKVDRSGNVSLDGSIIWGAGSSPTQAVYATSALAKPADGTKWSSFPASGSGWHRDYASTDYFASYTYDGGATWTSAVRVRGEKGSPGEQGYSIVAYVEQSNFTEANWSTYGTIGHVEGWTGTESIANGCRVGDLFAVVGTATDTKNSHTLIYRSDVSSGRLHGTCISHVITPRGAKGDKGDRGSDANVTHENVFNALTNNGTIQGIFEQDNQIYFNGAYIKAHSVTADQINSDKLHVNAANIDGTLTAQQIDADNLVVQAANVKGALSSNVIYVPQSYLYSSYTNGGTWIDGSGLRVYNADKTGINYLDFGITYTNIARGISTVILDIGLSTATAHGEWTFDKHIMAPSLHLSGTDAYRVGISRSQLVFFYNDKDIAVMDEQPTYVNLYGTWRANGSAWISGSDARWKNTVEDFTPAHDILFDHLRPRTYKWNEGTSGRTHSGFIVQEVVEAVEKSGLTTKDFAAVVNFKDENGEDDGWGLRYDEMISLNTWQIQKLKARIAELEGRLNYEVS